MASTEAATDSHFDERGRMSRRSGRRHGARARVEDEFSDDEEQRQLNGAFSDASEEFDDDDSQDEFSEDEREMFGRTNGRAARDQQAAELQQLLKRYQKKQIAQEQQKMRREMEEADESDQSRFAEGGMPTNGMAPHDEDEMGDEDEEAVHLRERVPEKVCSIAFTMTRAPAEMTKASGNTNEFTLSMSPEAAAQIAPAGKVVMLKEVAVTEVSSSFPYPLELVVDGLPQDSSLNTLVHSATGRKFHKCVPAHATALKADAHDAVVYKRDSMTRAGVKFLQQGYNCKNLEEKDVSQSRDGSDMFHMPLEHPIAQTCMALEPSIRKMVKQRNMQTVTLPSHLFKLAAKKVRNILKNQALQSDAQGIQLKMRRHFAAPQGNCECNNGLSWQTSYEGLSEKLKQDPAEMEAWTKAMHTPAQMTAVVKMRYVPV